MNATKLSCLSDVDLATLHRTRLNERVHYKLSWTQQYHQQGDCKKASKTNYKTSNANNHNDGGAARQLLAGQRKTTVAANGEVVDAVRSTQNGNHALAFHCDNSNKCKSKPVPTTTIAAAASTPSNLSMSSPSSLSVANERKAAMVSDEVNSMQNHSIKRCEQSSASAPIERRSRAKSKYDVNLYRSTASDCGRNAAQFNDGNAAKLRTYDFNSNVVDEDHFPILRRCRSGTWP